LARQYFYPGAHGEQGSVFHERYFVARQLQTSGHLRAAWPDQVILESDQDVDLFPAPCDSKQSGRRLPGASQSHGTFAIAIRRNGDRSAFTINDDLAKMEVLLLLDGKRAQNFHRRIGGERMCLGAAGRHPSTKYQDQPNTRV
tara:strand:- start:366 stop:794 length:429 start_codon:yes stop_codon:yes gene_type:complete